MKALDAGDERIQKICNELRKETLEPAEKEAARLITEAEREAERLIDEARHEAKRILTKAHEDLEIKKNAFTSGLEQAAKESVSKLRHLIECTVFDEELLATLQTEMRATNFAGKLLEALISAVEKEGLSADFSAVVGKTVSAKEVCDYLHTRFLEKLREKGVQIGDFQEGVRLKLHDKRISFDITDVALKELLVTYARGEFLKKMFGL